MNQPSAAASLTQFASQRSTVNVIVQQTPVASSAPTKWVNDVGELPQGAVTHVDVVNFIGASGASPD